MSLFAASSLRAKLDVVCHPTLFCMFPRSPKSRKYNSLKKMVCDSHRYTLLRSTLARRVGPHSRFQYPVALWLFVSGLLFVAYFSTTRSPSSHAGPLDPHRLTSIHGMWLLFFNDCTHSECLSLRIVSPCLYTVELCSLNTPEPFKVPQHRVS